MDSLIKSEEIEFVTILPSDYLAWLNSFVIFFSKYSQNSKSEILSNYQVINFRHLPNSVLNCIYLQGRYNSGCITIASYQKQIIAFSACHVLKPQIAYLGSRSCTLKGYEKIHLISTCLLPIQQAFFSDKTKYMITSFNLNEYSQRLMNSFLKRDRWTASKVNRYIKADYFPARLVQKKSIQLFNCPQSIVYFSKEENPNLKELIALLNNEMQINYD